MRKAKILTLLVPATLATACAGGSGVGGGLYSPYRLVEPGRETVARSLSVTPTIRWNEQRRNYYDISREENWTLNGPLLDNLTFVGGIKDGDAIVRQRRRAERQVPRFRATMSPPEIASMIETFYRIRAGSVRFEMTGLQPRSFLGHPGFQFDYDHLDSNEVERKGRAVGAIIDRRLYMALLDGTRMHYFPAALPEYERIVESARLRGSGS